MDGYKVPLDFYLSGDYKVRENIIYIINHGNLSIY